MKRSTRTPAIIVVLTLLSLGSYAGTTYSITTNQNWSSVLPSTCANCTINISNNAVLTIDVAATCQNCSFSGGSIVMNNQTLNLQYMNTLTTTTFTSVSLQANGSSQVIANAPLSLMTSTFTFNNTSSFNTSYNVDLAGSTIYLNDNATLLSTGSSSTMISLSASSKIYIGSGSQTSTASFTVSGPTLALYDKSSVTIVNVNNSYSNWASFDYHPTVNSNTNATRTTSTLNNNLNCGGSFPNACAAQIVYGPVSLGSGGTVPVNTLPVVLVGFSAVLNNDKTVTLDWSTQMEVNSSSFSVERSADGETWTAIGAVGAKGTSAVASNYNFTDESPLAGTNYYRLRMIDLDGKYGYTEVKVIRTSVVSAVSFFPNPAKDYVNVSLGAAVGTTAASKVNVRLFNMAGQVMQEKSAQAGAGAVVTFAVGNYAPGVYILSVVDENGMKESRQLVIGK